MPSGPPHSTAYPHSLVPSCSLTHTHPLIFNGHSMHPASTPEERSGPSSVLRPFMPELDTLRGIAVLGVMALHAFFWSYASLSFGRWGKIILTMTRPGWVGVNLFFVLSGFLITGILLDSKARPDYYRRFYTRRALRNPARLLSSALVFAFAAQFVGCLRGSQLHLPRQHDEFLWRYLRLRAALVFGCRGTLLYSLAHCRS